MLKTVYLCCHGQAEHDVSGDWTLPDPPLTAAGRQQCRLLAGEVGACVAGGQIEVVASSPLKRALQTALLAWPQTVARLGGPGRIHVLPQLQACTAHACDAGSSAPALASDPELAGLDLGLLVPGWNSKRGAYGADVRALEARAAWVRTWIQSRPEQTILLVAHSDFLSLLTGPGGNWAPAEVQEWSLDAQTPSQAPPLRFVRKVAPSSTVVAGSAGLPDRVDVGAGVGPGAGMGDLLPVLRTTGFDIESALDSAVERSVAETESRVHTRQAELDAQTRELHELDARLAAMEARAKQLEAAGRV